MLSLSEGGGYRDTYPGFIFRVLFPGVCDARVFLAPSFKNLTDNEQSPISTQTTYTPHTKTQIESDGHFYTGNIPVELPFSDKL